MFVVDDATELDSSCQNTPRIDVEMRSKPARTLKWLHAHGVSNYINPMEAVRSGDVKWAAVPMEGLMLCFSEERFLGRSTPVVQTS